MGLLDIGQQSLVSIIQCQSRFRSDSSRESFTKKVAVLLDFVQMTPLQAMVSKRDHDAVHLVMMTEYKRYSKGLMDIALLTANANQLRHTLEICGPYKAFLVALLSISILLQVVASIVLMVERMTCRKKDFASCHKYNAAIGCLTIIFIVVNILATAFGGPDNYCARYG